MAQATRIILEKRPGVEIIPSEIFTTVHFPQPQASDLQDSQILTETLYLSLDPIMSYWIRGKNPEAVHLNEGDTMYGGAVVRVLASKAPGIRLGDVGTAFCGWTTHAILDSESFEKKSIYPRVKPTDFVGLLGLPGLTGYYGMIKAGKPRKGDLVVVSTAAGATGSVAAQTAKNLGARVIGLTGSDDKARWLKEELELDEALNYKSQNFEARFYEVTKGKIDVYFDNVGGRTLELVLENLSMGGRIAMCGTMSNYEDPNSQGVKNYVRLALRDATMKGVNVYTYIAQQDAAFAQLVEWLQEGKIKRTETLIKGGIEQAPQALVDVFQGKNTGKMVLEVKNPDV